MSQHRSDVKQYVLWCYTYRIRIRNSLQWLIFCEYGFSILASYHRICHFTVKRSFSIVSQQRVRYQYVFSNTHRNNFYHFLKIDCYTQATSAFHESQPVPDVRKIEQKNTNSVYIVHNHQNVRIDWFFRNMDTW